MYMLNLRRLTKKSPNAAPIFDAFSRFYSAQNPNPAPTLVSSSADYDDLIDAAGRQRDFAAVRHLLVRRVRDGWFNTANTFKFLSIDVSILNDLLQNLASIDDWFTRKHAHDALVAQLARLHRGTDALRVAETMVKKKYGATSVTFHPILNALTRKKDTESAWRVVEVMRECNLKVDLTAFNYLLTAYCFVGDLASAADVLVKMEEEGLEADARTYDALVLGTCKVGKLDVALEVMVRMVEEGVVALYSTYAHVIKEMVRLGYFSQVVEFVKNFSGKDRRLDAENFVFLCTRLMNAKRKNEAVSVLKEMEERGLPVSKELKDFSAGFHDETPQNK